MSEAKKLARDAISALGLAVESVFVPFSQSRNKAEKNKSLNWQVTLKRNGLVIITTDYSAGSGHCPADKKKWFSPSERANAISRECELGKAQTQNSRLQMFSESAPIKPDHVSVIWSLVTDSDVLEHSSFEEWASNFGYETDSRKAESIYRACLEIALKLKAGIGNDGLEQLRLAFQDY